MVLFGTKAISCCSFCNGSESHDHLFFNCPFTSQVWAQILSLINVSWPTRSWMSWIDHMSTIKGKSIKTLITKLVFITSVYHIWIERNLRKFQNVACPVPVVVSKIYSMVRLKLLSLGDLPNAPQYRLNGILVGNVLQLCSISL